MRRKCLENSLTPLLRLNKTHGQTKAAKPGFFVGTFVAAIFLYPVLSGIFPGILTAHAAVLYRFADVQKSFRSSDALLYDRHGALLHQLRINSVERRLSWIALEEVSPVFATGFDYLGRPEFFMRIAALTGKQWLLLPGAICGIPKLVVRRPSQCSWRVYWMRRYSEKTGSRSFSQKISQALLAQQLEKKLA